MFVGCVIGRFQVPYLHAGHVKLLNAVKNRSKVLVVFIGVAQKSHTKRDPLDFFTRKLMIQENYPNAVIVPLLDKENDELWSRQIDDILHQTFPVDECRLYGGRDNCLSHYIGDLITTELTYNVEISGTKLREEAASNPLNTKDFRHGVIYAIERSKESHNEI